MQEKTGRNQRYAGRDFRLTDVYGNVVRDCWSEGRDAQPRMASDEVVQLYLTHVGVAGAPRRTLQGFQRIHLSPGARTVFEVTDGATLAD
jgi:hypothetical protein